MSLSESKSDAIIKMTRGNYPTWIEKIKDYIMALDHDEAADIWAAFVWVPADPANPGNDPAEHDYLTAANGPAKKLRVQHNKAFKFIRNSLSSEVFDTTIGQPHSVPKLLRHLRNYWNDGSVMDRDSLRMEFLKMKLDKYDDFDAYVTAFKNAVRTLKMYKVGLVRDDEDVCFQFNKGMPQAWSTYKGISSGQQHSFEQAVSYYRKMAKSDSSLPGALKAKPVKSKAVYSTHDFDLKGSNVSTTETCRQFARGLCKRGDNCRYKHVQQPPQTGDKGSQSQPKAKFKGKCNHCGKPGHKEAFCWKKKRDEAGKSRGADSAHATSDQGAAMRSGQEVYQDGGSSSDPGRCRFHND